MEGEQNVAAPDHVQAEQGDRDAGKSSNGLKARKRTKTGCLTCRRRRIKCGEEKPTCKNCTKSKRECEGYVPRVIFKDPVNAIRADMSSLHGAYYHGHTAGHAGAVSVSADGVPLAPLAPRPSPYHNLSVQTQSGSGMQYPYMGSSGTDTAGGRYQRNQMSYNGGGNAYSTTTPAFNPYEAHAGHSSTTGRSHDFQSAAFTMSADGQVSATSTAPSMQYPTPRTGSTGDGTFPPTNWSGQRHMSDTSDSYDPGEHEYRHHPVDDYLSSHVQEHARQYGLPASNPQWGLGGDVEADDDYYDVDSEEEKATSHQQLGEPNPVNLGLMMKLSANQNNPSIRSITNFLNGPNMLATYTPIYSASPLMDPQTAMVFCHFIAATGPTLNVFERHPSNPSIIFTGRPAPQSQRSLWSYTMPMLALTHQGLLQAMLALSSLHIAKIQRTSPTPSLKHYHYALRRVAKALSRPDKRRNVATLAATLLLGFYEVTTAEHNKWNSHLSGARELIMEIDFVSTARRIERARAHERDNEGAPRTSEAKSLSSVFPRLSPSSTGRKFPQKLDPNFIGTISGWRIQYDEHGPVAGDMASREEALDSEALRPHEVEEFEIKCDLFWWYAKQDVFQSILSGNRLLLPYERWGECPPRAPMGRQDAAYGSMDHLMLLMSRLADYAAKDLPRKRKAAYVATSPAKSQHGSPTKASGSPPGKGPPPMYGMIPDPGPIRLPTGFDQVQHDRIYSAPVPSDTESLDQATQEAEAEHAAISHAFDVYFEHLGPSFAPLAPEHMTPTASPFGPAIYYRSYTIACVVSLYYCGRIIICRTAPNMPPAAMAAAGVAAASTAGFCNLIGRISAGIQPVSNTAPLNPQHGAALMDSCMGLFHAGVQYHDAAQRGWLITKLRDISRLTGWQTSALIASGCERAWVHAADMGRGPPYERTMNAMAQDDRVAGRSRDPRLLASPPRHNNDRRFVHQNAGTRVYWAMGILSVEEDMRALSIEEAKADEEKRLRQQQQQQQQQYRAQIPT